MTQRKLSPAAVCFSAAAAVVFLLGGLSQTVQGQVTFQTRYTLVSAASEADFLTMERRLRYPVATSAGQPRLEGEWAFHPAFPRLAAKIDAILLRTSELLNLRPLPQSRLHIILLANGKEVRRRHLTLVPGQRQGLLGFGALEAFYEAHSRTIYLSLRDLHEGILAHEMTHYLLCTAVSPRPPSNLQEAWAHYVESHL